MRLGYAWRIDSLYPHISAAAVGNRLSELEAEHGVLTKSIVLHDAKRRESALYPLFERNAQTALEKWNSVRAHQVLNSLVVMKNGKKTKERAFVFVYTDSTPRQRKSYVSLVVALRTPTLREQIVERGVREYLSWANKYGSLSEFASFKTTIRKLKKQIEDRLLAAV